MSKISRYDPLDLFSGEQERCQQAILHLLDSPQNNCQTFIDGRAVPVEDFSEKLHHSFLLPLEVEASSFLAFLVTEMLHTSGVHHSLGLCKYCRMFHTMTANPEHVGSSKRSMYTYGEKTASWHLKTLLLLQACQVSLMGSVSSHHCLGAGVLPALLKVQKLDRHDIEGIHSLYQTFLPPVPGSSPTLSAVDEDSNACVNGMYDFSEEETKAAIRDYLIAATAKDCSIMVAFQRLNRGEDGDIGETCTIDCSLHLADLEFKPMSKLKSHFHLDQEILQNARDLAASENQELL